MGHLLLHVRTAAPAPTITSVDKSLGDASGGTVITALVNSSTGCTAMDVCGVTCTGFTIVDATHVRGTTGAMTASATPGAVGVTNGGGRGALASAFEAFLPTNPTTVNGCALRADLGVTLDGSLNVQTWADQGIRGRSFARATANQRPNMGGGGHLINGKATINNTVNAANFPSLLGPVFTLTAAHAFFVLKPGSTAQNFFWKFMGPTGPGNVEYAPFTDETTNDYYIGFGSSARKSALPLGLGTTAVVIEIITTSSEWTCKVNGTTVYTTATNTVQWDSTGSLLLASSGNATDNPPTPGVLDLAEFDCYEAKLSAGERTRYAAYILDRYGISI